MCGWLAWPFVLSSAIGLSGCESANVTQTFVAVSIFLVALTICIAIAALCYRVLNQNNNAAPVYSASLLSITISLFGILITGVFVITTFRIDDGARQVATEAVEERLDEILPATVERRVQERLDEIVPETVAEQTLAATTDLLPVITGQLTDRLSNDAINEAVFRATWARQAELRRPPDTAAEITVGSDQSVEVSSQDGYWLYFEAGSEGTYVIRADGIGGFDPFIYVYESSGSDTLKLVQSDDDGGGGRSARVDVDLSSDGTYYVQVQGFGGSRGECTVSVEAL